ncbi:hypothetical protein SDC9_09948 [bioreactor metagenome]|uniref:Uncharacterized protein n=1 Tax=bioreactor metagenome TaxID=1076179 RepID=A0A644TBJ3_9ZZZZ
MHRPRKRPKDFDLHEGSEFKRAETKLREKHAAEKGWKQDVSNRPLSRSDLGGHLSERRAFRVSFVRAAYGATGVKQNPGDITFVFSPQSHCHQDAISANSYLESPR